VVSNYAVLLANTLWQTQALDHVFQYFVVVAEPTLTGSLHLVRQRKGLRATEICFVKDGEHTLGRESWRDRQLRPVALCCRSRTHGLAGSVSGDGLLLFRTPRYIKAEVAIGGRESTYGAMPTWICPASGTECTRAKPRRLSKRYTPEFRQRMVDLLHSGRGSNEPGREFGVSPWSIRRWAKQAERAAGEGDIGLTRTEREELSWLRLENQRLTEERALLAKAAALLVEKWIGIGILVELGQKYILGRRWDVLCWNRAATVVFGDYSKLVGDSPARSSSSIRPWERSIHGRR
jgi:transposase